MSATADDRAVRAINDRMLTGDVERGNALLERIIHLALVTDRQQQFMHQTVALSPQDARDIVAALAVHGLIVVATEGEGQ